MQNERILTLLHLAEEEVALILLKSNGPLAKMVALEDGLNRLIERRRNQFNSRVNRCGPSDCWLWTGAVYPEYKHNLIYGKTLIFGYGTTSHRAAYLFHNETIRAGMCVCHRCDVPLCCNPDHLFEGTQLDNIRDCISKGRIRSNPNRGSAHYSSILNEDDVIRIRELRSSGLKLKQIAIVFGIDVRHVSLICLRKRWTHI